MGGEVRHERDMALKVSATRDACVTDTAPCESLTDGKRSTIESMPQGTLTKGMVGYDCDMLEHKLETPPREAPIKRGLVMLL